VADLPLLRLSEGLLEATFAQLRNCGDGRRECVCYWAGPTDDPALVDGLLHPIHVGHRGYYEVDGDWINHTWLKLAKSRETIRAQIHTHAGRAFHSHLDNDFPIVQTDGFLSLVIPAFAEGDVGLDGAYVTRLTSSGGWAEADPFEGLEVGP
jgi:hypothetical protein